MGATAIRGLEEHRMRTFEEYVSLAGKEGSPRSGIVLGLRMALHGLRKLKLDDPQQVHDHLIVVVETDRCLPDAMELVTGCRLGNRRLRFEDMGKMAATLFDFTAGRAIRLAAREEANQRALELFPQLEKEEALEKAYRVLPDEVLFATQFVEVELAPEDLPGNRPPRVLCAGCGESIGLGKQIVKQGKFLCRSCAGQSYYKPQAP